MATNIEQTSEAEGMANRWLAGAFVVTAAEGGEVVLIFQAASSNQIMQPSEHAK
jgi:hypothetical protein